MALEKWPEKNVRIFSDLHGPYGAHGDLDTDTVTLNQELVIQKQSIGIAEFAQGFQGVDGIFGWVLWPRIVHQQNYAKFTALARSILHETPFQTLLRYPRSRTIFIRKA